MPESKPFQVQRETFYKATLPNGRKAELKNDVVSVWTRSGEELVFGEGDVRALQAMYDARAADRERSKS